MDTSSPPTAAAPIAHTLRFHPVAEYFRSQFARALRWGLTPSAERITCIAGHACTNLLRLEVALAQGTPILATEMITMDDDLESPSVTQRVLLDIVHTVPLLQPEVHWLYTAWEHLRQARNGKGRDLVVHGLSDPFVQLLEQQRLTGGSALILSRFVPLSCQTELATHMVDARADTAAVVPTPSLRAEWRPVWQAVAAGNLYEAKCLKEQRGWSERHMFRVRRAVTRLGSLIDLPFAQRQLLALSTWPTVLLDTLRADGQITLDGTLITTVQLQKWSVDSLTQLPARLPRETASSATKGHA
jgi:hypothetical protein